MGRRILKIGISVGLLFLIVAVVPFDRLAHYFASLDITSAAIALALLIAGVVLSSVRLGWLMGALKIKTSAIVTHKINVYSQIAGLVFFQSIGQMLFRSSYGARYIENSQRFILITLIEKFATLISLAVLAGFAGFYLNQSINISAASFKSIGVMILAASLVLPWFYLKALSAGERKYARRGIKMLNALGVKGAVVISFAVHLVTLLAYVFIGHALLPDAPIKDLLAAFSLVMLGAAVPISFAGWGVRELSAGLAFKALGYDPAIGVLVAAVIGILAICAIGVSAAVSANLRDDAPPPPTKVVKPDHGRFERYMAFFGAIAVAMLVSFQLRAVTESGEISLNLADPFAVLSGFTFFVLWLQRFRGEALWIIPGFKYALIGFVALILYGWGVAEWRYGANDWATYNRLAGLMILFAYLGAGASLTFFFGQRALVMIAKMLIIVSVCCFCVRYVLIFGLEWEIIRALNWHLGNVVGFSGNRNAYAFVLVITACLLLGSWDRISWRSRSLPLAWLLFVMVLTGSRTGWIASVLILVMALYVVPKFNLKKFVKTITLTAVLLALNLLINASIHVISSIRWPDSLERLNLGPAFHARDYQEVSTERFDSYISAIQMWAENPILGSGLGTFLDRFGEVYPTASIIHNSFLWVFVEMGVPGILLFSLFPITVGAFLWRRWRAGRVHEVGSLALVFAAIILFSLPHEIMYQRILWFVLGALAVNTMVYGHRARKIPFEIGKTSPVSNP